MKRLDADIIDYYNNEVVKMICEKYNLPPIEAFRSFALSKTHEMLENVNCDMTEFGAGAIFEMWKCEKVTGDQKNCVYLRGE